MSVRHQCVKTTGFSSKLDQSNSRLLFSRRQIPSQTQPKSLPRHPIQASINGSNVKYSTGTPKQQFHIVKALLSEKLNFLALNMDNFIVATSTNNNDDDDIIAFGQLKELSPNVYELCSMYVDPAHRRKNIGSGVVSRLLARTTPDQRVYLITPTSRTGFYTRAGFEVVDESEAPPTLKAEIAVGGVLAKIVLGESLVVMKYSTHA